SAAGERADPSVASFLEFVESGDEGPGLVRAPAGDEEGAVQVLTAHGAAGREFDTVLVGGTVEGNFPSLSRSELMFDLAVLDRPRTGWPRSRACWRSGHGWSRPHGGSSATGPGPTGPCTRASGSPSRSSTPWRTASSSTCWHRSSGWRCGPATTPGWEGWST